MKKSTKLFWRSFFLSATVMLCLSLGFYGAAKAYENTVKIGFGIYRNAIELTEDGIRIFDFYIF